MNAKEILKFNFDAASFGMRANSLFDNVIEKTINATTRKIEEATQSFDAKDIGNALPDIDPEKLFKEIKEAFNKGIDCTLTKNELRVISFNLHLVEEDAELMSFIIAQLNNRWSNLYLLGFIDYVFREWNFRSRSFNILHKELISKTKSYEGAINRIAQLKSNLEYIEDGMPEKLGMKLTIDSKTPFDLTEYVGLPEHTLSYKYFSGAIISYYKIQSKSSIEFDDVLDVLRIHNKPYTDKVVLSIIVNNRNGISGASENRLISATKHRIGSYNNVSAWNISNAPNDIQELVEQARRKIKLWQNKKQIESFFDAFVAEGSKRKSFWIKYVEVIDDIKIFVASSEVRLATYDQKKKDALTFGYSTVSKGKTSAFVMKIGNYVIIEFSDTGALYVYENNSSINNLIKKTNIDAVGDLKNTGIGMLVEEDWYFWDTGRLFHSGRWRYRLSTWLYKKNFISAGQVISEYEDSLY